MHIVKFQGGLGNQMFQYALYRKFQFLGYDTCADLYPYLDKREGRRTFDLPVLGIRLQEADRRDILRLFGDVNSYADRIRLRVIGKKTYYREKKILFDPRILETKEGYFNGYWQSEKYFLDIRDILLREFRFPAITDNKNLEWERKIKSDRFSVSIHVRMGDYLKQPKMYGGICTEIYYKKAIDMIKAYVEHPHFYVFSNNTEAAKKLFEKEDCVFVGNNPEEKGYIDMKLMSGCRHQIIANSSFSWWAAWLNRNEDKIVISPSEWFGNQKVKDIWCDGWRIVGH